eukprot:2139654-Pyramimonas_sp.AAC.1
MGATLQLAAPPAPLVVVAPVSFTEPGPSCAVVPLLSSPASAPPLRPLPSGSLNGWVDVGGLADVEACALDSFSSGHGNTSGRMLVESGWRVEGSLVCVGCTWEDSSPRLPSTAAAFACRPCPSGSASACSCISRRRMSAAVCTLTRHVRM